MNNPIFVFEGVKSATLTASAGSATGFPTTNLQDDRHATLWKSGASTSDQTLKVDFGAAKAFDSILIPNHNLVATGIDHFVIEHSDNNSDWTLIASLTPDMLVDPFYYSFGSLTKRYCRGTLAKTGALSVAPQIGMLYVGARVDMPLYLNSPERGVQADAVVAESMSGLRYSTSMHGDRETWKLSTKSLTAAQLCGWARLVRGVNGMQYPFWFCDIDGNWHFVRFKKNYLPWVGKGNVAFPINGIEFDEERVSIAMNLPGGYTLPAPA